MSLTKPTKQTQTQRIGATTCPAVEALHAQGCFDSHLEAAPLDYAARLNPFVNRSNAPRVPILHDS